MSITSPVEEDLIGRLQQVVGVVVLEDLPDGDRQLGADNGHIYSPELEGGEGLHRAGQQAALLHHHPAALRSGQFPYGQLELVVKFIGPPRVLVSGELPIALHQCHANGGTHLLQRRRIPAQGPESLLISPQNGNGRVP